MDPETATVTPVSVDVTLTLASDLNSTRRRALAKWISDGLRPGQRAPKGYATLVCEAGFGSHDTIVIARVGPARIDAYDAAEQVVELVREWIGEHLGPGRITRIEARER